MATSPFSRPAAIAAHPTLFLFILLTALALLSLNPQRASAAIHYVTMTGTGDGSTWAKAGPLQAVITKSKSGDQVWAEKGIYVGNFTATDGVAVYGGFAGSETSLSQRDYNKNLTFLDANGTGTVYTIPTAAKGTNTLDGFTAENGPSRGISDPSSDKLIVANCNIKLNSVYNANGGGIYANGVTLSVSNCVFTSNGTNGNRYQVNQYGGGLFTDTPTTATITGCTFSSNSATQSYAAAGYGGAICTTKIGTISNCYFSANSASGQGGGIYASGASVTIKASANAAAPYSFDGCTGGGVYAVCISNTITGYLFHNNGGRGAAVLGPNTSVISNCTFNGNTVYNGNGAGLYAGSLQTTVTGCAFSGNSGDGNQYRVDVLGGGVYAESGTLTAIRRCSFSGNTTTQHYAAVGRGGGIGAFGTPVIAQCTFSGNTPDQIEMESVGDANDFALVADNLIYGTGTGMGNGINLGVYGNTTVYAAVVGNTIFNTNAGLNIGSGTTVAGEVDVANNIFYKNNGGVNYNASATFVSSHNDLAGNTTYKYQGVATDPTDLSANPAFVSTTPGTTGFLVLSSTSALIDAGNDDYIADSTDLAGNPRKQGSHVDIGCYETPTTSAAHPTSLSPSTVQAGYDAFTLTVNGTGFVSGAKVVFGSTALATTFVSSTKLTATVPASLVAAAGTASVYVNNPNMGSSASLTFTVSAASTITSLSPASKPAGNASFTLTVAGTGFMSGAVVFFNGTALTTTYGSSTKLTATVPASAVAAQGAATVAAANPHTAMTNALSFMITTPIAVLTKLSPSSIQVGSSGFTLTITGTYFVPGAIVKWNGTALTSAYFSATAVAAQVPSSLLTSAGTASVTVTNPGVAASNTLTFTVTAPPAPAHLLSLSPSTAKAGSAGFTLTLTGTGFVSGAVIMWGSTALSSAYFNATTVVALVPSSLIASSGTASVTVANPGSTSASNILTFTITK